MKKSIGSDENADIILSGRYIDKIHAELSELEDRVYLIDLNSKFGTFVNGKRILAKTELIKRDRVKIGTQLLHWQDYLENPSKEPNKYPIYLTDLFDPRGYLNWGNYRIGLVILVGFLLLTPIAVPAFLLGLPYLFRRNTHHIIEELNLMQYSEELTILICLVLTYIILNLTQKFVRLKFKNKP